MLSAGVGEAVSKERVSEYIAGGSLDSSSVRTAVSRLRTAIGGRVASGPTGYRLTLNEADFLDAVEFERLVASGSGMPAAERSRTLEQALALWRGRAFAGYEDEPWSQGAAVRLERMRAVAVEDLAETRLELGRPRDAIALVEPEIARAEFRERPISIAMRALAATGQLTEALRTFQRFRTELRENIGIEPSSELAALEALLLENGGASPKAVVASGTVTFLFTDIEGSSALWDRVPRLMERALARHDHLLRGAVADAGGDVFATGGDGFAVAFQSAEDAVQAAVNCQFALLAEEWDRNAVIRVRMGLHTGVAERRDGDYYGRAVSRAARISAAAHGCQVLLSAATAALIADGGWTFLDAGELDLRGFERRERVFCLAAPGLNVEDLPAGFERAGGNLPRQRSPLIGRSAESKRLSSLLQPGALITLVGPGGAGKTRLALSVADVASPHFADGAWLVELGEVSDPDAVAPAVATALDLRLGPAANNCEAVSMALGRQERLLILDNCEHVIDASAELIESVRVRCPHVTILVTSRELLGLDDELAVPVRPLGLDSDEGMSEAAQLFCDRADGVLGGFAPDLGDLGVIEQICRRLDGLPLAIELAAARVAVFGVQQLLDGLNDRFDLLTRRRGAVERQRSLRTTVAWSYDLLSADEQVVFDRLSIFPGDFDLAAADSICGFEPLQGPVVDRIASLVERSLLTNVRGSGAARYQMLETLRQYAEEKLEKRSESNRLRQRHLDYFVAWTERADAGIRTRPRDELRWHHMFAADWHNLRGAVGSAIESDHGDAACRIIWHSLRWTTTRLRLEVGDWADKISMLSTVADHPLRPIVLAAAAMIADERGDWVKATKLAVDARDEELRLGHAGDPWVPDIVGLVESKQLNFAALQESRDEIRRRSLDDPYWRAVSDRRDAFLVRQLVTSGQLTEDEIESHLRRVRVSLANAEAYGNPNILANIQSNLGACLIHRNLDEAVVLLEHSLDLVLQLGADNTAAGIYPNLAYAYSMLDRPLDALALLGPVMRQDVRSGAWTNFLVTLIAALRPLLQLDRHRCAATSWGYFDSLLRDAPMLQKTLVPPDVYDRLVAEYTSSDLDRFRIEGAKLEPPDLAASTLLVLDELLSQTKHEAADLRRPPGVGGD
jgi:predicted ATPase/class 3 adenylate cyclase